MASVLTHMPRVHARYLRDGEDGVSEVAEDLLWAASRRPGGKFGKTRAAYLPISPFPPALWRPNCGRCRFWVGGEPGTPGRCRLVGRPDDRFGGEAIHPDGVCGFYTPPAGEPPFAWFHDRLDPTGADSVRGQYRHPLVAETPPDRRPDRKSREPEVEAGPASESGERDGGT